MNARVVARVLILLLLAGLVAACGPAGADRVVDGWPIGERLECSTAECESYLPVAEAGLRRRDFGHAEIVDSALHKQGTYELENGDSYLPVCSGGSCPAVAVFTLSDGSTRAIGVGSPGIGTDVMVSNWGPALNFEAPGRSTTP